MRLADYNQGRRYGNGSGQAGAFGANTGFGGFGQQNNTGPFGASSNTGPFGASSNTGGGLFGAQATSTPSPFGSTQTAGSGFGSGTGGGIFGGGAKPAGGLFGAASTTPSQPAGSLFGGQSGFGGSSSGTGTGFGNTSGTAGGGLFGSGSQPTQKPGFSLGGAHTGTGFGTGGTSANNNTGGIFGNNQASSGFGSGQQQAPASNPFGAFGTGQAQNQSSTGSVFSGFGAANQSAQKPGGMFGSTPANSGAVGGGLFGNNQSNNQQQPSGGGLFGSGSNNQPGGSSLFTQKQNSAGTGLFGNSSSSSGNNVGGGLFGGGFNTNNNNQPQQNQGGGLFGNNAQQQQQQPKQGSIFGGNASGTGGGLFGNNNNQQPNGSSLFGNMGSNNQQQSSGLFGTANNNGTSLFGTSQQQQPNALQPPQPQYASALDASISPYGSSSLYSGLPPTPHLNAGPIATPISKGQKLKKGAVLPQYKINPNQASRLVTPQKRGFGFSYSTYGTPSSISSNASTPGGFNSSLLYSSIGRSLGKSLSTSNLRRSFDTEGDSILTPGAFSAGGSRFAGSGSLKKLTIDRSLRTDLFGGQGLTTVSSPEKTDQSRQLGILKKKVSFDASTVGGNGNSQNSTVNNTANGVELREDHNDATPSAQEQGFLRSSSRGNPKLTGPKLNGASSQLEIEQIKGNELAIVHEDEPPENTAMFAHKSTPPIPQIDPQPGEYWMKPSIEELSKLSKDQLRSVSGFSVGRRRCGHVEFNEPVDLTLNPLEAIFKKFALIEVRSLTVYPDSNLKPSRGQGMNVPSTIFLQNSWPRQLDRKTPLHEKSGPRFNKHVDRLRKVTGTEFVRYEKDTGIWVFKVPHFTTYALDFDDTGSEGDSLHTSIMSEMPDTPTPKTRATRDTQTPNPSTTEPDSSILSDEPSLTSSSPDDTFEFRKKKTLPGAFDNASSLSEVGHQMEEINYDDDSFLDQRLAVSPSPSPSQSEEDEPSELEAEGGDTEHRPLVVQDDQVEMAGSFPDGDHEHMQSKNGPGLQIRSILKKTDWKFDDYGTPTKLKFNPSGDWADELQRTISPRKQDRQALRLNQSQMPEEPILDREITPKATLKLKDVDQPLVTSIDLMNSLFGKEQARRSGRGIRKGGKGKGFEV